MEKKTKEERNIESLIKRINNAKTLASNKKLILEFYNERVVTGTKIISLIPSLRILFLLSEKFSGKPFKSLKKNDLQKFFSDLKPLPHNWTGIAEKEFSPRTVWSFMARVKSFWKWLYGLDDDEGFPVAVKWIKKRNICSDSVRKRPIEVLSRDEVLEMIRIAGNERDKALLALLFETGLRAKELLEMKKDDLVHEDGFATFKVIGKGNKERLVLIEWSYPYLKEWLAWIEKHEENVLPEFKDFIWISFPRRSLKRFVYGSNGHLMHRDVLRTVIVNIAKRTGIKKRVWTHGFRHSSATDFAKQGYNETELRLKFGWSKKSNIPSNYTHYNFDELKKKILIKSGKSKEKDEFAVNVLASKKCLYCSFENSGQSKYCNKCGNPLNFQKIHERKEEKGLDLLYSTLEKIKELEGKGVDLKQFNTFIESWAKTNKN